MMLFDLKYLYLIIYSNYMLTIKNMYKYIIHTQKKAVCSMDACCLQKCKCVIDLRMVSIEKIL